jgi:hypothetical protein
MLLLRCPMLVSQSMASGQKTHKEGSGSVKGTGAVERAVMQQTTGVC